MALPCKARNRTPIPGPQRVFLRFVTAAGHPRGLRRGDLVELRNFGVQEYYDQTEIVGLKTDTDAAYRVTGRCESPAAVLVPPLTDPRPIRPACTSRSRGCASR